MINPQTDRKGKCTGKKKGRKKEKEVVQIGKVARYDHERNQPKQQKTYSPTKSPGNAKPHSPIQKNQKKKKKENKNKRSADLFNWNVGLGYKQLFIT